MRQATQLFSLLLLHGCSSELATRACLQQTQQELRGAAGGLHAGSVTALPATRNSSDEHFVVEIAYTTRNQRGERVHRKSSCQVAVAEHGQAFVGRLHY